MSKEIKHGNEHVNTRFEKVPFDQESENRSNRRVIRVLYFIVGLAVGVLIMKLK